MGDQEWAGALGWARSGHQKLPSNAGAQVKQPHPARSRQLSPLHSLSKSREQNPAEIHHPGTEPECCRSCQHCRECPAALHCWLGHPDGSQNILLFSCAGAFWVCVQRAVGRSQVPAGAPRAPHWGAGSSPRAPHPSLEGLWAQHTGFALQDRPEELWEPRAGSSCRNCPRERPSLSWNQRRARDLNLLWVPSLYPPSLCSTTGIHRQQGVRNGGSTAQPGNVSFEKGMNGGGKEEEILWWMVFIYLLKGNKDFPGLSSSIRRLLE